MGKSHFPIDLAILNAIKQLVEPGSTIVELGSGNGTNKLTKEFTVYSIEDNSNWIGYCEDSNYIHAPLVKLDYNREIVEWYDPEIIEKNLPENYDLILIDGPAGKKGRSGFLANMELFNLNVPIVIDDTLREHECNVARETAYLLNRPMYMFWNFSIITPEILNKQQIAKIQNIALQVLDREDEPYLSSYFSTVKQKVPKNFKRLEEVIKEEKEKKLEFNSLKSSRRKLELIENSLSLKLGRIITSPTRFFLKLIRRN
tara:strand:+ start:5932 stop:6705 length:774 start_codon:yes stop_codon:yes gene_type:complete